MNDERIGKIFLRFIVFGVGCMVGFYLLEDAGVHSLSVLHGIFVAILGIAALLLLGRD